MHWQEFLAEVRGRSGHFAYESGYHSDLWLDLESLCSRPTAVRRFAAELAEKVRPYRPEVICGPLVEGAFLALIVAPELQCEFAYALRIAPEAQQSAEDNSGRSDAKLFPVTYSIPESLRASLSGRRVAIVNDVISAGSAVRGTFADLKRIGCEVVCCASLVLLGESFRDFTAQQKLPLEALVSRPNNLWAPAECPLCRDGAPLERLARH